MSELVEGGSAPVDRLEIFLGPRQLDVIVRRSIECLVAAEAQVGPAGADQRLDLGHDQPFRDRRRNSDQVTGSPSHWATLNTVKRLRNGIAFWLVARSRDAAHSSSGTNRSA